MRLADKAPILYEISATKIVRISQDLAMKCGASIMSSEAEALRLAREKAGILVPRVYRAFQVDDPSQLYGTRGYLVMDYIKGRNLGDCWKQLAKEEKDDAIRQVEAAISQLQSTEIPTVGPIGGGVSRGIFLQNSELARSALDLRWKRGLTTSSR